MNEQPVAGNNASKVNQEQGGDTSIGPIKRKKSIKNLLSKRENVNSEQLEQLIFQNKQLKQQLNQYQTTSEALKKELLEKDDEIFVDKENNVVLTPKTYGELVNKNVDRLNKDDLSAFLHKKFNLKVITATEYHILNKPVDEMFLKSEASNLGFTLLERQEYDFMKSKMETPDEKTVKSSAGKMGLELLSSKEVEHLKNPTKSEMEKRLKKLGFAVVSESNRNSVVDVANSVVSTHTAQNNESARNSGLYSLRNSSKTSLNSSRVLASRDFFEQVIKDENSNKDVVLEAGRSLGFVRLSQEQYKKLLDGQKEKILTKTDVYSAAKNFYLTVLPNEEYKQLLKNRKNRQSMTFEDLNEYASKFKLRLIPNNRNDLVESHPESSEKSLPSKNQNNSNAFLNSDFKDDNVSFEGSNTKNGTIFNNKGLTENDVKSWCNINNYRLTQKSIDEEVNAYSKSMNLKLVPNEEYQNLLLKTNTASISLEQVKEYVQNNNLKLIPQIQYNDLKALKNGKTLNDYGKNEITAFLEKLDGDIHIMSKQGFLDLNNKIEELEKNEMSLTQIKEKFPDKHILSDEQLLTLKNSAKQNISFDEVKARFPELALIKNTELDDINKKLSMALKQNEDKLDFNNIEKEIKQNHLNHTLVLKSDFNSLESQLTVVKNQNDLLLNQQHSKATTIGELEKELQIIDPSQVIVNKEEMFKALEDTSVSFAELLDILEHQYPDFTLLETEKYEDLKHNIANKEHISINDLQAIVEKDYPDSLIIEKKEFERMLQTLSTELNKSNSLDSLSAYLKDSFPESMIVNRNDFQMLSKSQNKLPKDIKDLNEVIEKTYPDKVVVEKSNYQLQLQNLAQELKENEELSNRLEKLQNDYATIDSLKEIVVDNHPSYTIVDSKEYETLLENQGDSTTNIDHIKEVLNTTHPEHVIINKNEYESSLKELSSNMIVSEEFSKNLILLKEENAQLISQNNSLNEKLKSTDNTNKIFGGSENSEPFLQKFYETNNIQFLSQFLGQVYPDKLIVNRSDYQRSLESQEQTNTNNFDHFKKLEELHSEQKLVGKLEYDTSENISASQDEKISSSALKAADYSIQSHEKSSNKADNISVITISKSELYSPLFIKSQAEKIGLSVIDSAEMAAMSQHFMELGQQQILFDDLKKLVEIKFDSKIISNRDYNDIANESNVDLDALNQTADEFGLSLISNEELEELNRKVITLDNRLLEQQNNEGSGVSITEEQLNEKAIEYGLVVIPKSDFDSYKEHDIFKEADRLGLKLLSLEDYDELKENKHLKSGIESYGSRTEGEKESLFTFEQNQSKALKPEGSEARLVALAAENNMTVIPTESYKQILKSPTLTKELLVQRARDFDMIAIDLQQFTEITKANMEQNESLQDSLIKVQDNGYVPISRYEYEALKNPTRDDIANLAYNQWNMVLVERNNSLAGKNTHALGTSSRIASNGSKHNSLIHVQPSTNRKMSQNNGPGNVNSFSEEERGPFLFQPFQHARNKSIQNSAKPINLVEEAKKQNLLLIPESMYLKDLHQIPPLSRDSKDNGLLLVERNQLEGLLNYRQEYTTLHSNKEIGNNSLQYSPSANTTQSSGGFSNDKIIVSLTQTVIGEYLYKYYSKFGVFGKQRHERYFWIHPFTMTLYWSTTNPSNENAKNVLDNKTKGVSIIGVEVIEDSNPYPPGLYTKSIVILTKDGKNVKITCPTMQRHKVWLRSLKYLQKAASKSLPQTNNGFSGSRIPSTTSNNKLSSHPSNKFDISDYSNNMNQRLSPEVEQHPKFFVNSLK